MATSRFPIRAKYAAVFLLSVLADFVAAVHIYALAKDWMPVTLLAGFFLPFVSFLGDVWFIESKTNSERLTLTFCSALGIVAGTGLTLLLLGE